MTPIQVGLSVPMDLGEGPLWHIASQRFLCVDIHGCAIHAWSPATGEHQTWKTPERIGWLIPRTDGDGFIAGFQSGFARLWLEPTLRWEAMGCPHPHMPDVRLNDAKADCMGRIWAGSMNNRDPSCPDGQLTRLDPSGGFQVLERNIHIANGPAIAHDAQWLLHTDSWRNTTYRYRIDAAGQLAEKTVWRQFADTEGTPDGMTMDSDGNVWIAFWGGACIRQFTPQAKMLQQIDLPATQITSMAFGGTEMNTLFITSARNGLSEEQLAQQPQAGYTFVVQSSIKGALPCTFG